MQQYSLQDAQLHLGELIEEVIQGKTIIIVNGDDQAVQLVAVPTHTLNAEPPQSRRAGSARGKIRIAPDFDEPLSDFDAYMR